MPELKIDKAREELKRGEQVEVIGMLDDERDDLGEILCESAARERNGNTHC